MIVEHAPDIDRLIRVVLRRIPYNHIKAAHITGMRSHKATSRAYARIWGFPKIWQMALNLEPHYVIEVLSHHFDKLSDDDKTRTIIHELMHIPKNFSGALVPHRGRHLKINHRTIEQMFQIYKSSVR